MNYEDRRYNMLDAFPNEFELESSRGMTLRDYFAAKIMQGIFSNSERESHFGQSAYYVKEAYSIADAMLKERENETSK